MLIFLMGAFLVYGAVSLSYFFAPETDPLRFRETSHSLATKGLTAIFFLIGLYGAILHRSVSGRLFGLLIALESVVAATRIWSFWTPSISATRLCGSIEGAVCFAGFAALFIAVRRGASIWK